MSSQRHATARIQFKLDHRVEFRNEALVLPSIEIDGATRM